MTPKKKHALLYIPVSKGDLILSYARSDSDLLVYTFSDNGESISDQMAIKGLGGTLDALYLAVAPKDGYIVAGFNLSAIPTVRIIGNFANKIANLNLDGIIAQIPNMGVYLTDDKMALTNNSSRFTFLSGISYPNFENDLDYVNFYVTGIEGYQITYGFGLMSGSLINISSYLTFSTGFIRLRKNFESFPKILGVLITIKKSDESNFTEEEISNIKIKQCFNINSDLDKIGLYKNVFLDNVLFPVGKVVYYRDNNLYRFIKNHSSSPFDYLDVKKTSFSDYIFQFNNIGINDAQAEFMRGVNSKAKIIGMDSSIFVNPYGGSLDGYNTTTAYDLLKLTIHCCGYPKICDIWGLETVNCNIYGENARSVSITNDIQSKMDVYYPEIHPGETNPYKLLGNKAGGWSSGTHKVFCLCAVVNIGGRLIAAVVSNTTGENGVVGRIDRVKAMIELLDICSKYVNGESIEGLNVTFADKAIAAIVPSMPNSPNNQLEIIYKLNEDVSFNPASTTKLLSAMVMLDCNLSMHEYHSISGDARELINDSSYEAKAGDVESVETSFYAMLMASNAANTLALARLCGEKMLFSKSLML